MKLHLNIGSVLLFTADLTNYVSLRVRMVKRGNRGMLWRGEEIPETTNCIHAWRIEGMMVEQLCQDPIFGRQRNVPEDHYAIDNIVSKFVPDYKSIAILSTLFLLLCSPNPYGAFKRGGSGG